MNQPSSSTISTTTAADDLLIPICAASALCLGLAISLLQLDPIARRILRDPERLRTRRRSETTYRINTLISREFQKRNQRHDDDDAKAAAAATASTSYELFIDKDELNTIIDKIVKDDNKYKVEIVGLGLDEGVDLSDDQEYYLFLELSTTEDPNPNPTTVRKKVQVPLVEFGVALAEMFEGKLTSHALCFIADASSGLSSRVLGGILKDCDYGLAIVKEPVWMTALAWLVEKRVIRKEKMEKVLFALCRLEAWRLRDVVGLGIFDLGSGSGSGNHVLLNPGDSRTIVFFLPGQSSTATLLPLLQKVFPCERHVFAYDTCTNATHRALASSHNLLLTSSPLRELRSLPTLSSRLQKIPARQANAVEAWMSSVDAFLRLKDGDDDDDDDIKKSSNDEYLPFVHRMGFIMGDTNVIGHDDTDRSALALTNVLQFITGTRSRPLPQGVMDKAQGSLRRLRREEQKERVIKLSERERLLIEDCVFAHKGILIGDKTLMDTVQPATKWTLKAAKKVLGCSCCAPEEEDDDDKEEEVENRVVTNVDSGIMSPSSSTTTGLNRRTNRAKYVDGKTKFAFDPTAFQ